jgi:multicomponent Na+:H+ antiporter subunit D
MGGEYAGLARQRPFLSGAFAVLGFALVGVPPTIGFVGKWYIGLSAVESRLWPVVAVVVISTVLSLLYMARLLENLYFDTSTVTTDAPGSQSTDVAADGGGANGAEVDADMTPRKAAVGTRPPYGMIGLALVAAIAVVGLGFVGADLTTALDPVVEAVIESSPEVTP